MKENNKKIKVAFIGAGFMADAHLHAFADIENVSLVGITSRTLIKAEVLAEKYGVKHVYNSIDEMYNDTQADLAVISVNELALYKICLESFKFPWKILVEKPVGYNFEEAQLISTLALNSGVQVFIALNRRHYSSTKNVIEALKDDVGQRVVQVFDQENPAVAIEAGTPQKVVDNWMYANSIHLIDYFNVFCRGQLTGVQNVIRLNNDSPFFLLSRLSFSSGDIGVYQAIWEGPGPWAVTISTQLKLWELRPLEKVTKQAYRSRVKEESTIDEWDITFKPGIRSQAQQAVNAVLGMDHTLPTLDDGLHLMLMIKNIYEA
jgi:predicted dehydrogenase